MKIFTTYLTNYILIHNIVLLAVFLEIMKNKLEIYFTRPITQEKFLPMILTKQLSFNFQY